MLSDLRPFEVATSIRPPRPFKASTSNSISEPLERPSAKIVSLKDDNFFILQDPHLRLFEATTSSDLRGCLWPRPQIRPPRVFEAVTSNRPVSPRFRGTSEATRGQKSKKCYFANFDGWWRVSARGSGERSEPAAGRPRK